MLVWQSTYFACRRSLFQSLISPFKKDQIAGDMKNLSLRPRKAEQSRVDNTDLNSSMVKCCEVPDGFGQPMVLQGRERESKIYGEGPQLYLPCTQENPRSIPSTPSLKDCTTDYGKDHNLEIHSQSGWPIWTLIVQVSRRRLLVDKQTIPLSSRREPLSPIQRISEY